MFFEPNNSIGENIFWVEKKESIDFPMHLHRSFEGFFQLKGSTEVIIDGKTYLLNAGDAVLIFPFQSHSYLGKEKGEIMICLFSPDIVNDFFSPNKLPVDNIFSYMPTTKTTIDNVYEEKAFIYSILGCFEKDRNYYVPEKNSDTLLTNLLLYAEENYKNTCLLSAISKKFGYDYAYVSKLFKRKISIGFNRYITILRINESKKLLKTTQKSVTEIAEEVGFSCLRTFNRSFISMEKISPREYRKLI